VYIASFIEFTIKFHFGQGENQGGAGGLFETE
jgi:hypothetical protein